MPTAIRRKLLGRYYALLALGYSHTEAANLLGSMEGLAPMGWTQKEVARLLFLAHLYRSRSPADL